jgi:hypothetical protein
MIGRTVFHCRILEKPREGGRVCAPTAYKRT